MDRSAEMFSQDFNFKEAEEAPDDQLEIKDVYFNSMGSSRLSLSNQMKKKPKKQNTANYIRDQIDKVSKIKEQEMNQQQDQIKINNKQQQKSIGLNTSSLQQKYKSSNESDNEYDNDEMQHITTTVNTNPHQFQSSRQPEMVSKPSFQNGQSSAAAIGASLSISSASNNMMHHQQKQQQQQQQQQQQYSNYTSSNANNIFEQQNSNTNNNTSSNNNHFKNPPLNNAFSSIQIGQKSNKKITISNESDSSDQEYQEPQRWGNNDRSNPSAQVPSTTPFGQNQSKISQAATSSSIAGGNTNTLTQQTNNRQVQQKQSQFKVGATCVQNKKNKKRRLAKGIYSSNQQQSQNLSQVMFTKKAKPLYGLKSSQSSNGELDDDVEDDDNSTLTQKFQQKSMMMQQQEQIFPSNPYSYNQHSGMMMQQSQYKFNQPHFQQQQQRSQDQNDTSDLSPSIGPKFAQSNMNNQDFNQQLQDSQIQNGGKMHMKQQHSSSSFSNESDIEDSGHKRMRNGNLFSNNNTKSPQFFQLNMKNNISSASSNDREMLGNQVKINQLQMKANNSSQLNSKLGGSVSITNNLQGSNLNPNNNIDNFEAHIQAAASIYNLQQQYLNPQSSEKKINPSPSRIQLESAKRNPLHNIETQNNNNNNAIGNTNAKNNGKADYYQREKLVKMLEGDDSIVTVRIENVSLKPFQTVIAEIITVDRINPQLISCSLKPSQLIHAILKQNLKNQNTLKVGGEYTFKFQTLESSSHLPIINVNDYIQK